MGKVVKKFGGTSLQTRERINLSVAEVIEDLANGDEVVSVVSAMGREGDPYATDTLIGLMEDVAPELDLLKKDLIMSCGEVISASLFSHYLDAEGYDAIPVTGYQAGIFTDDNFGNARIIGLDPVRINRYLGQGKPVILAGFQGRTVRGEITTLGRGGSDTTALTVGGALGADLVEIYTDVPGVAVVDPGLVDDPPFFTKIPRDALLKLARGGAEVIHPRAVKSAINYDVPFSIKCSWKKGEQTIVADEPSPEKTPVGIAVRDDYKLVEGREGNGKNELAEEQDPNVVRLEDKTGEQFVMGNIEPDRLAEIDKSSSVSVVTGVPTVPDRSTQLKDRISQSVDRDLYIDKRVEEGKVSFLVNKGKERSLVQRIYNLFY